MTVYQQAKKDIEAELFNAYTKINKEEPLISDFYRYNHLQKIEKQIEQSILELGAKEEDFTKLALQHATNLGSKTVNNVLETGVLNKGAINQLIKSPWAGSNYSDRIWKNKAQLIASMKSELTNGIVQGKSIYEVANMMDDRLQVGRSQTQRLVRTEYMHALNMGQIESYKAKGYKKLRWVATMDNKTSEICRSRNGKEYDIDNLPDIPAHPNCRCTYVPVITQEMIDEDEFGIKLNKPEKVKGDTIDLGKGMLDSVGKKNYDEFHKTLNSLPEGDLKEIFRRHGEKLGFVIHKEKSFADRNVVNVTQESFGSSDIHNKMEVVYHEIGHAFDNLGVKITTGKDTYETGLTRKVRILKKTKRFAIEGTHMSSLPEYELKEKIRSDLWNYIYQGETPYKKGKWPEYTKIDELISNLKSEYTKKDLTGVSDMLESTGWTSKMPLGTGHGTKYWDRYGMAETEFFAHATEIAMNEKAGKIFKEVFPESYATYEQMLKDILKGG